MVFLKHYSMYAEAGASDADLWSLQQGAQDSLSTFMHRLKDVMPKISAVNSAGATAAVRIRSGMNHDFRKN